MKLYIYTNKKQIESNNTVELRTEEPRKLKCYFHKLDIRYLYEHVGHDSFFKGIGKGVFSRHYLFEHEIDVSDLGKFKYEVKSIKIDYKNSKEYKKFMEQAENDLDTEQEEWEEKHSEGEFEKKLKSKIGLSGNDVSDLTTCFKYLEHEKLLDYKNKTLSFISDVPYINIVVDKNTIKCRTIKVDIFGKSVSLESLSGTPLYYNW